MKHFFSLIIMFTTAAIWSQTNTFNGAEDTNWNNGNNWSLNLIPTSFNDVVIPTGKTVAISAAASAKSIQLLGTAVLNLSSTVTVSLTTTIAPNAVMNWNGGIFDGGGVLNNAGTINLLPGGKTITGGTTFNNTGLITHNTDWSLDIANGTLNNLPTGIIDLQFVGSAIIGTGAGSHLLNNSGLIKRTTFNGSVEITAKLVNSGIISVETGILQLNNPGIELQGGIYNITADGNLVWANALTLSGNLTGNLSGSINWSGTVNVPVAASINFTGSGVMNWGNGHLSGGGALTNLGMLSLTPAYFGTKYIDGGTTLNNAANLSLTTDWALIISDGIFNNLPTGVIALSNGPCSIDKSGIGNHTFNNAGLIRRNSTIGTAVISADLNNTGTITVESGYLDLSGGGTALIGGTYNTSTDAYLRFQQPVQCSGIMTGTVDGGIHWNSNLNVPVNATFNFSGANGVYWSGGELNGGGQLNNTSKLFQAFGGNKIINGNTTLNNSGTFTFLSDSGMTLENGTINNAPSGVIDFQVAGLIAVGTGTHAINNAGLFKKTASTGTLTVNAITTNTGTIQSSFGRITFDNFNNTPTGIVTGAAEVQFSGGANFTNNGIFAPGGNPGVLSVATNYDSTAGTRMAVELYGITQDTQYDRLAVWGNAAMNGSVVVDLHFAPAIGNQFIIATATAITACNLTPTTTAVYNGNQYVFSVGCQDDNKVVLELTAILAAKDNVFNSGITLYPNPAAGSINLRNESGKALTAISISDVSGRNVMQLKPESNTLQKIDLGNLAAGTYLVKITSGNDSALRKIIVE